MEISQEVGTTTSTSTDQKVLNLINISFENLNYSVKVGLLKRSEYLKLLSTYAKYFYLFMYIDTL